VSTPVAAVIDTVNVASVMPESPSATLGSATETVGAGSSFSMIPYAP